MYYPKTACWSVRGVDRALDEPGKGLPGARHWPLGFQRRAVGFSSGGWSADFGILYPTVWHEYSSGGDNKNEKARTNTFDVIDGIGPTGL